MSINYRDMTRQFLMGEVEKKEASAKSESEVLSEGPMNMQSLATQQFAAAIKGTNLTEANPDGTISSDEDDLEDELMYELIRELEGLVARVQIESDRIGGSFRGPGIRSRLFKAMAETLHKAR